MNIYSANSDTKNPLWNKQSNREGPSFSANPKAQSNHEGPNFSANPKAYQTTSTWENLVKNGGNSSNFDLEFINPMKI